jgi:hypothetical protein
MNRAQIQVGIFYSEDSFGGSNIDILSGNFLP